MSLKVTLYSPQQLTMFIVAPRSAFAITQSSVAVDKYYLAVSGRSHSLGTFQHHTYQFWQMSSQYNQYSTFSHQTVDGKPLQKFLIQIYCVIFSQGKIVLQMTYTLKPYQLTFLKQILPNLQQKKVSGDRNHFLV